MNARARRGVRPDSRRRGTVIVLFAAGMVLFIGVTALVVDVGMLHYFSAVSDRGVNAAALSAARAMARPGATAEQGRSAALAMAEANGLAGFVEADIEVNPFNNNQRVVRLTPTINVPAFFAPLFGVDGFNVPHRVYAMGGGTGATIVTRDFFEAANHSAPSAFYPLFLYHGSLRDMAMANGATGNWVNRGAALSSYICHAGTFFNPGDEIWFKGGSRTQDSIGRFLRPNPDRQWVRGRYRGSYDIPYGGIPTVESRYDTFMRHGSLRPVVVGQTLNMIRCEANFGDWIVEADNEGVTDRVAEDPSSLWNNQQAGSARTVIVPIVRANVDMDIDLSGGTPVDNLLTLPYIYPQVLNPGDDQGISNNWGMQVDVVVIGLAKVWLVSTSDVVTANGMSFNVVRGIFVDYVGTPPNGQMAG